MRLAEGDKKSPVANVNFLLSVEKLSLLYLTIATSNMITEWRAKGGGKSCKISSESWCSWFYTKQPEELQAGLLMLWKLRFIETTCEQYCFSELAAFLKISSPWWKMLCKWALCSVAKISFFILKPQTNHQWCPQE